MAGGAFAHDLGILDVRSPTVLFQCRYDFFSTASHAVVPSGMSVNDVAVLAVLQTDTAVQMQGKFASQIVADVAAKYGGAVCNKVVGPSVFVL